MEEQDDTILWLLAAMQSGGWVATCAEPTGATVRPDNKQGGIPMTMRPDPTFHASPKLAMEAAPENFAYTLLLCPDFSQPDALAVIDVKPGSPTFSRIVHTVTMPYKGDEFHHFGWNACSSALSPLTGHAFLERRYLIIPGLRSSRIYVVDTKPDPTEAKIHKIIEPEEVLKKTGYSRPHTVHCGPEGIYVSTLGGGGKDGTDGPPGASKIGPNALRLGAVRSGAVDAGAGKPDTSVGSDAAGIGTAGAVVAVEGVATAETGNPPPDVVAGGVSVLPATCSRSTDNGAAPACALMAVASSVPEGLGVAASAAVAAATPPAPVAPAMPSFALGATSAAVRASARSSRGS
jgi:hypothetical protein